MTLIKKYENLVLFDVGGVLLRLDFKRFYRAAGKAAGISPDEFKDAYVKSKLELYSLKGAINKQEYFAGIRKLIGRNISDDEIGEIKEKLWVDKVSETIDLKKRIYESGNAVGIMANTDEHGIEKLPVYYPDIYDLFNDAFPRVYSFRVGHVKPEKEMYGLANTLGFKKIIFVDDNESYLRFPTEKLGWHGIHFTRYIDESEAIRANQSASEKPAKNIIAANSAKEIEKTLRDFGIKLR